MTRRIRLWLSRCTCLASLRGGRPHTAAAHTTCLMRECGSCDSCWSVALWEAGVASPWWLRAWELATAWRQVAGYWIRPYDMVADRRRWRWQRPSPCGTELWMTASDEERAALRDALSRADHRRR